MAFSFRYTPLKLESVFHREHSADFLIEFQHGKEGFLRHFHVAYLLHALFTSLLLFKEFALTAHVTSVALGGDVLTHGLNSFARNNFGTYGSLYGYLKLLAGDKLLQFLAHAASQLVSVIEVSQRREGIHRLAIKQNVQLDQLGGTKAVRMIIERRIAFGDALQLIVEVYHDFAQRHVVADFHAITGDVFLLYQFASLTQAESHDGTDVVGSGNDGGTNVRLLNMVYHRDVGHRAGIVHLDDVALFVVDIIGYVGHGSDDVHVELTVQAFLHNLHVEQAQESAPETKAQS